MAAAKTLIYRSVSLEVPYSTDGEGNAVCVNRSVGKVNPEATDAVLYEAVTKLATLMNKQPNKIIISERHELAESL